MTRSAGYHGKIPTQGDFIQHGLPSAFTRAWDRWLGEGLAALKDRRGEAWLGGYRSSPIWRFHLPAGAFGERAMVGVVMASFDRVGRNFPLTIAAEAAPGASSLGALLTDAHMLDQMAETALRALADRLKKDALDAAVDAIIPATDPPPEIAETGAVLTVKGADPAAAIASRWLERRYSADSAIFLSDARAGEERQLIATQGAPEPGLISQLFEGGGAAPLQAIPAEDDLDLLAPIDEDAVAPVVSMAPATEPSPASDDDLDALIGGEPFAPPDGATPPSAPLDAAADLPPELDPGFDPTELEPLAPAPDPSLDPAHLIPPADAAIDPPAEAFLDAAPPADDAAPAEDPRPVTEDEIDALIGSAPLSGEEPDPPPLHKKIDGDDDEDPIAAILAGGGPES